MDSVGGLMVNPAYRKDDGTFDFEKMYKRCLIYASYKIKMLPTKSVNPEDFASYSCIWYLENKKQTEVCKSKVSFYKFSKKKRIGWRCGHGSKVP